MYAHLKHGFGAIVVWSAAALSTGCGGDSDPVTQPNGGAPSTPPSAAVPSAVPSSAENGGSAPVYLYRLHVYHADGATAYTLLRNSIDPNVTVDDLKTAKEFPGYTGMAVIGGNVITGDSESPFTTKWRITEKLEWEQVGQPLNFGQYFMADENGLNFHWQAIRGNDLLLFYGAERTSRVLWNVADWKIIGNYQDTKLPKAAGWTLYNPGNRAQVRDFAGPVVWPFEYSDDVSERAEKSYLAVYDPATQAEKAILEVPCPRLQQTTKDENGNLYFSTHGNDPSFAIYGQAAPNCVVRVNTQGAVDEAFGRPDFRQATGGVHVNFRYMKNGKAVANVAHPERIPGFNPTGPFDPTVACKVWGCEEKPELFDRALWDIHVIDLASGTAKVITGWRAGEEPGFHSIYHQIEGRIFLGSQVVPDGKEDQTYNNMYELDLDAAKVTPVGKIVGDLQAIERVR
jgi:hypothetical protein